MPQIVKLDYGEPIPIWLSGGKDEWVKWEAYDFYTQRWVLAFREHLQCGMFPPMWWCNPWPYPEGSFDGALLRTINDPLYNLSPESIAYAYDGNESFCVFRKKQ